MAPDDSLCFYYAARVVEGPSQAKENIYDAYWQSCTPVRVLLQGLVQLGH